MTRIPEWILKAAEELEGLGRHYPLVRKTAKVIHQHYIANKIQLSPKDIKYDSTFEQYFVCKDNRYLSEDGNWDIHCGNGWFKSHNAVNRAYKKYLAI